jgi:gamma-glutamyltranspeptidase / glutathione hydrolase
MEMRDFFLPGRSPVLGLGAAVAASHPLATFEALRALARGGNAVDAAVVATAVLCVVEPQSTGLGGDSFALISRNGTVPPIGYNGSGRTPRLLEPQRVADGRGNLADTSVHSVTVPGTVETMARLLADHGTWSLMMALEPAIHHAESGFPVHQKVAAEWAGAEVKLRSVDASREIYLPYDRVPRPGEVIRCRALAATLRKIADGGAEAFYAGEIAESMVAALRGHGGYHSVEDFAAHQGGYVEPVSQQYGAHEVWQIPPNGQGVTVLLMLAILEVLNFGNELPSEPRYHHLLAEASRLSAAEAACAIGDPEHGEIDVSRFLDRSFAADLALNVGETLDVVRTVGIPARGDTAYVAVVDQARNCVSMISSLFENFGCGITDPESGVVFQCRGAGFSLEKDHPNSLAPHKRPFHTIIPGMMSRGGRVVATFGVTGGPFQPVGQCKVISAMIDRGLDVQAAIDEPRSFYRDGKVFLEPPLARLSPALRRTGHRVELADQAIGGAHSIQIDWESGVVAGGSDGRKDGCALAM